MPLNALIFDAAGCAGGGAGFEAYRDKIDCFRSVLPGTPGVLGPTLDGLAGGADAVPPKKSNPNRLSPGLVCFGGATGAFGCGGALLIAGSVVLGLAGAASFISPNKSTCGCALILGGCGSPAAAGALPFLMAPLLARALSCTTFSGTSSSSASSKLPGSGIGPSITHLLESYFVRIKFSIFASLGTWPSASLFSQYLFALLLPHFTILPSCSSVHESRSTDLTLLMCTPRERCIPEQRIHMKTPKFQAAHRGCLLRLQSAHDLFVSSLTRALRAARLRSAVSAGTASTLR